VVSAEVITGVLTIVGLIEGSATVTLTADDGNDGSASMAFTVTVEAANVAPEVVHDPCDVTLVPLSGVATGDLGLLVDADGDSLRYSVQSSADSLATAIVEASALMLTPLASGQTVITVTATDPTGATASLSFSITVSVVSPTDGDGPFQGDFVDNGAVDFDDFFLFADNFGRLEPEPEPSVVLDWCL